MINRRNSIRLNGYDYSQSGAYFATVVTKERECLFGEIVNDEVLLSTNGKVIEDLLIALSKHFSVTIDSHVIMPNHFHAIITIDESDEEGKVISDKHPSTTRNKSSIFPSGTKPNSLGAIIQNFKSVSTRRINAFRGMSGVSIWQRNYYDHIIRNEKELNHVRRYILENPCRWLVDDEYRPKEND